MRKIIPFEKEILFKSKLKEVTSISLEHNYKVDNNLIKGEFLVGGDYKITASSINREDFSYKIPFEIELDSKYDSDTINLDIENFYYEIINEEILKVNIDVFVEGEYKKVEDKEGENQVIESKDESSQVRADLEKIIDNSLEEEQVTESSTNDVKDDDITNNINTNTNTNNVKVNLFDNVSMEDTYSTYYVYIVKEDDTLDKILNKYNISREELEDYNDLSSINYLDKIIIPSHNE